MGCAQRPIPKTSRSDRVPVDEMWTNILPPTFCCDNVVSQIREFRFSFALPNFDTTLKLLCLTKEHPPALPVVDFVRIIRKLGVNPVVVVDGREEERSVIPIEVLCQLLKILVLPGYEGRRLRLWSLTDDDIRPVTKAFERFEVLDLLPDSHPPLDQVALVLFVVAEEDDVTSHINAVPLVRSADTPGWNRGTEIRIMTKIHNIIVDLLIGVKDTQIVVQWQGFLLQQHSGLTISLSCSEGLFYNPYRN